MWCRPLLLGAVGVLTAAGCGGSDVGSSFRATCVPASPVPDALATAGRKPDGTVVLPGGRLLTPKGRLLSLGGFPLAMRVLPAPLDRYVVVTDGDYGDEALRVVDTEASDPERAVVSRADYPRTSESAQSPALFYGLALTRDGTRLYVSGGGHDPVPASEHDPTRHYNVIDVYALDASPGGAPRLRLLPEAQIRLPFSSAGITRLPAGIALSADETRLYVVTQLDATLAVIDLASGLELGRTPPLGIEPYDLALDESDAAHPRAYVSLWGGSSLGGHQFMDGVVVVDVSNPRAPMPDGSLIATGKSPEATLLIGGKLYVPSADEDTVTIVDAGARTSRSVPMALDATGLYGSTPNNLAADLEHGRLYVANAGENAVQAFDLTTMRSLGRIPTGWYPTAVAVRPGGTVLIAAAKGLGAGATDHSPGRNDYMQGTLHVVPMPSAAELQTGDDQAHANLGRPHVYEVALTCSGTAKRFPLPAAKGDPTPIEHVFLVVRENKTYDAVLGDLAGANGRASLTLFGEEITPNLHALARRFALLDNFYSLAEQSLQGHEWTTANMANDFTEKAWATTWGRGTRPLSAFAIADNLEHLAQPKSKTIWQLLDGAHLDYHNYGEVVNSGGVLHIYDTSYPGVFFNTDVLDVDKIAYVIDNLRDRRFHLEPFSYIGLPNDHTVGTTPGKPTPASMVADNDEATGRLIDALSHSRYWMSSVVFIIEDDPQDGGDHVELHRSPCLVVSPWTRSGAVSSVNYDVPSLWRTITLLLGTDPLNQRDAQAAAMYDLFAGKPDARPYTFVPRKVPPQLNSADAPLAAESARIDFSRPDQAPLGRILWKAMRGRDAEPPWGTTPPIHFRRDDDD